MNGGGGNPVAAQITQMSAGPQIDSKLLARLKELPDKVSLHEQQINLLLSDVKRLTGEDLAAKVKALSAQLFKKAEQDKVQATFSLHESKLADLEQRLKDMKDSGVKDSGFDNNIDEYQ